MIGGLRSVAGHEPQTTGYRLLLVMRPATAWGHSPERQLARARWAHPTSVPAPVSFLMQAPVSFRMKQTMSFRTQPPVGWPPRCADG